MLAVDSSSLIAFAEQQDGTDVALILEALMQSKMLIPPVVVSEVLSNPSEQTRVHSLLNRSRILPVLEGYWQRAGILRRTVLLSGRKAKLPDALIAQSCIDHDIPLITRDTDFRHYVETGGLKLAC